MDRRSIEQILVDLPMYSFRYYESIGSTNDAAAQWADQGAPDLSLIIANEQTAGRGRDGRRWYTPPGSGLAFSLVLYSGENDSLAHQQLTALGALALQQTIEQLYSLPAKIKWPNDVLIDGAKVAGILAEMQWVGNLPVHAILGIGINIAPESISQLPDWKEAWSLPVVCMQDVVGEPVNHLEILHGVLRQILYWRPQLGSPGFIQAWEAALAFRDEWVYLYEEGLSSTPNRDGFPSCLDARQILGLAENGALVLRSPGGEIIELTDERIHIRPASPVLSDALTGSRDLTQPQGKERR